MLQRDVVHMLGAYNIAVNSVSPNTKLQEEHTSLCTWWSFLSTKTWNSTVRSTLQW
jgi:hypothetical protein